jgi:hypothetical protein
VSELKTRPSGHSVTAYVRAILDPVRRRDCITLKRMMRKVTGRPPKMWSGRIVGFGSYHYRYASGREGDFFLVGFAPGKRELTLYIMPGYSSFGGQLEKLGPHRTGKSCLYVRNLEDLNLVVLESILADAVAYMRSHYECR